ncbi:hypothetical protein WN944_026372 [Citrus x changshan-huyou]|uniref:Uncharacterized protein n=1 Tax=Citrus x changshan-huyou TaxID=2935761 RepID=A0AAP0LUA7_9ROSI
MAMCEGLELAAQLGYFMLEVESNSSVVVSWIHSQGLVHWNYAYALQQKDEQSRNPNEQPQISTHQPSPPTLLANPTRSLNFACGAIQGSSSLLRTISQPCGSLTKSSSDSGGGRLGPNQIFLTKRLIRPQGKKVKEMKVERGTDP